MVNTFVAIQFREVSVTAVGGGANQGARVGKKRRSILGTLNAGSNRNFKDAH
jgi:hypothetical protein